MATSDRLRDHLAEMVMLEARTGALLDELSRQAAGHTKCSALIEGFRETSAAQERSARKRLETIAGETALPDQPRGIGAPTNGEYPVSAALRHAHAALNDAVIGYAMLRTIALRNRDSILAGEGNTGDMAEAHARNYADAVHRVNQVLHDVVVWEFDQDGETCRCTCPSCGLGICLCAQAPRRTLSDIWSELGPIATDTGVAVQRPRPDSLAADAGLEAGDMVVAADGQVLDSHFLLQGVITRHKSGEIIELRVQRKSGQVETIEMVCP